MIKFLGIVVFTWLFVTGAEPIQFVKEWFGVGEDDTPKKADIARTILQSLLNCCLCMGFWFGLGFYLLEDWRSSFWMACLTSVSAEAFYKVVKKLGKYFLEV